MPSARSPGCNPSAIAMKKRPSKVPISTIVAGDAELGLAADHMAADRGGEARRHAGHARIAIGEIAVDGGVAAGDIDHPPTTFGK